MATAVTTLTPEQFHRITRALADPNRYEMLTHIYSNTACTSCTEALGDLSITPPTASHHLRELELADLITVTKDGRFRKLTPRRDIWRAYLAQLREL